MISYGKPARLRRDGKLSSVYYVRTYDDATGRRSWKSSGCTSLQAAREWRRTQEMDQALGKDRLENRVRGERTFNQAYTEWIEEKRDKVCEERHRTLKLQGDRFWLGFFGTNKLSDINADLIRKYLRKRRQGTILKPGAHRSRIRAITANTANSDLQSLRNFFKFCRECRWISHDPLGGIERYSGAMRRRTRTLTTDDEDRLLAACRESQIIEISAKRNVGSRTGGKVSESPTKFDQTFNPPDYLYPLVLTALKCGFRRRTLLSVRWRDVDLKTGQWRIPAEFIKTAEAKT